MDFMGTKGFVTDCVRSVPECDYAFVCGPTPMVLSGQGLFWGLLTAAAVTVYSLLPRRLLAKWGRSVVTGVGMLIGGLVLNLLARSWANPVQLPPAGWLAVLATVLLGSVVAFSLFMELPIVTVMVPILAAGFFIHIAYGIWLS